eukprot:scaffold14599_cov200-Alexandrium_tamarense.AAC.2
MARSWGDGSVTQQLHELAFDMYEKYCDGNDNMLGVTSYRKLPVLSVAPGQKASGKVDVRGINPSLARVIPNWLDGSVGRLSPLGFGDDTAQITPKEFVEKMVEYMNKDGEDSGVKVVLGKCTGIEYELNDDVKVVTGVKYTPSSDGNSNEEKVLKADDVIVSAGPWSCQGEQWFEGAVQLPMEGVKSTSIVWKPPKDEDVDATALFCGEDYRFGTHCKFCSVSTSSTRSCNQLLNIQSCCLMVIVATVEVYPRPDGSIYICGIGGSDYITTQELQSDAFLTNCPPKEDRMEAAKTAFQTMSDTYATKGELMTVQACMRPCPPDAKPYMGSIPGYEGAYINAGHNCWGIAWAPACGKGMAELVLEGQCHCLDLTPFNPARFTKGSRGGRGRKKGNMNVGEQW